MIWLNYLSAFHKTLRHQKFLQYCAYKQQTTQCLFQNGERVKLRKAGERVKSSILSLFSFILFTIISPFIDIRDTQSIRKLVKARLFLKFTSRLQVCSWLSSVGIWNDRSCSRITSPNGDVYSKYSRGPNSDRLLRNSTSQLSHVR